MVQRCIRRFGLLGALTAAVSVTPAEAAFTTPIVVTDEDVAEPAIDIANDGTIYINAPVGLLSQLPGSPSLLMRSQNDGASWQLLDPGILRGSLPGGGDSEVVLDPNDGTVYYTDLYLVDSTISVSRDKGNTWTFSNPVGGVPVHDRQWLATSGGGIVYHTYNQTPTGLWVTKSIDGGLTWVLGSIAATAVDRTGCLCPPGTIVAEDGGPSPLGIDDRVGVIYSTSTGGIKFARSTNGGLTWSQRVVSQVEGADTVLAFPVVARARNQNLHAAWLELVDGRTRVRYSRSTNFGQTWSQPIMVISTGTPVFPWLDARGSKVAIVVYHSSFNGTPDDAPANAQWYAKYVESTNSGVTFGTLATLDPTRPVKIGPICTEGTFCAEDRELLDFLGVAVGPNGKSYVTWARVKNEETDDTEVRFSKQP